MNAEERLATIYGLIVDSGVPALVMGGHAVRFYGVSRNTFDYDVHFVGVEWERLPEFLERILSTHVTQFSEVPSWRPRDFRRFIIGRLPDGREERLECWRRNHLLAEFTKLYAGRAEGLYGGRTVAFLGLSDLLHLSKVDPGSSRHLALVEAVRRLYKRDAMDADRQDKLGESGGAST